MVEYPCRIWGKGKYEGKMNDLSIELAFVFYFYFIFFYFYFFIFLEANREELRRIFEEDSVCSKVSSGCSSGQARDRKLSRNPEIYSRTDESLKKKEDSCVFQFIKVPFLFQFLFFNFSTISFNY